MRPILFLSCTLVLLAACGKVEDTRPGTPVAHRQQAFKTILNTFEPLGIALRENRYRAETFLNGARALEAAKDAPWGYFGADTNYPPSRSLESVWSDAAGFARERDTFLTAVSALRQSAERRDEQAVRPAYEAVQASCRSCHKAFKGN
ncbi:MAG: cytochrome c [Zoogloeaceae bacterium]|jgi:cytochrome c556|nr:cytochrome c [Zoogloeaceae bacterium]